MKHCDATDAYKSYSPDLKEHACLVQTLEIIPSAPIPASTRLCFHLSLFVGWLVGWLDGRQD